jgi:2-polyprenyl-3-methyl-5-hydroxy-6-metoxy-1,4-benzoquinol methylase
MKLKPTIDNWFGTTVDPYSDPWYRFSRVISLVERHSPIPVGTRWLDVGCQIGQFLKLLQAKFQIIPTGIDNFEESKVIEVCRKYFHIEIKEPSDVINDSWRYLFRWVDKEGFKINEKFPFISALEVLEHMIDTDAFLKECYSHLETNGYLIISTPNINSLRNRVQVPLGVYPAGMEFRTLVHHVRLYNVPTLKSHLKEHGFELVAMTGVNFLPAKLLRYELVRRIDAQLAHLFPSLCGNIIAIFKA